MWGFKLDTHRQPCNILIMAVRLWIENLECLYDGIDDKVTTAMTMTRLSFKVGIVKVTVLRST